MVWKMDPLAMPSAFCTGMLCTPRLSTLCTVVCMCINILCPRSATGYLHRRVVVHDLRYFRHDRLFNICNSSTQRRGTRYPDVCVSLLSS